MYELIFAILSYPPYPIFVLLWSVQERALTPGVCCPTRACARTDVAGTTTPSLCGDVCRFFVARVGSAPRRLLAALCGMCTRFTTYAPAAELIQDEHIPSPLRACGTVVSGYAHATSCPRLRQCCLRIRTRPYPLRACGTVVSGYAHATSCPRLRHCCLRIRTRHILSAPAALLIQDTHNAKPSPRLRQNCFRTSTPPPLFRSCESIDLGAADLNTSERNRRE